MTEPTGVDYNEGTDTFEVRRIGDHEYKVEAFGADRALTLGEPLMEILAGSSTALMDQMGMQGAAREVMNVKRNIFIDGKQVQFWQYVDLLFAMTAVDGNKMEGLWNWKQFFKRKGSLLIAVLTFILEVNYASFLPELQRLTALMGLQLEQVQEKESEKESPPQDALTDEPISG